MSENDNQLKNCATAKHLANKPLKLNSVTICFTEHNLYMAPTLARTHLEYLLLEAMIHVVPDIAATCREEWIKSGLEGEPDRNALVNCLLHKAGPKSFLEICEQLPAHAPESPLMFFLFNSASPGAFISKISRHAPHFHPTRRLELVQEEDSYCIVEDIANHSSSISIADDLFVHSILKGGLSEFGCRDIQVNWEAVSSKELYFILKDIGIHAHSIENVTRWKYSWEKFTPSGSIKGMDEFFLNKTGIITSEQNPPLTEQVVKLLLNNISQRPSTEEIAVRLGISPRTMQRKLKDEGTNYSKIYSEFRLNTAKNMLQRTTLSVAQISTLAGFNDSAHFCREFKKIHNTTPSNYRQVYRVTVSRHKPSE